MQLVLASTSPRRREILELLGVPFAVVSPEFVETLSPRRSIAEEVSAFARGKAESVLDRYLGVPIIGSDTMIALGEHKIGKPTNIEQARSTLEALAGKRHRIYTSVCILDQRGKPGLETVDTVDVEMHPLTREEIDRYLKIGESLDKAGAYSIQGQGGKLISSLRGDYLAAVGLPLQPIAEYLDTRGIQHADVATIYAGKNFQNWQMF